MKSAAKTIDETVVSTNPSYTFFVTGDRTLTAVFERIPVYTITAAISPDGSGSVTGAGQYQEGATVTLVATPADGYKFSGWQEGGQTVSADTTYSFTATADRALVSAFAEKAPSRLPAGYTEVKYIAATGGNCVIDTGQLLQANIKTIIDFEPISAPTSADAMIVWNYYAAARVNYSTEWLKSGSLSGVIGLIGSGSFKTINSNVTPRRMTVEMDNYNGIITADRQSVSFTKQAYNRNSPNVFLFGSSGGAMTLKAKLYSCKIYLGSSLERDFVPCKNSSGVSGLYDLVSKAFFGSITSTAFTAGPAA